MPIVAPNLDDRTYDDLVEQARSLIPRYMPEWTNHNDSDPGITMMQLFAWFTDLLVYRVNQVPDLNYIKFLQLLGIQAKPASPASADLTFTTARQDVDVIVPAGTQAGATAADGSTVVFELPEGFTAIGAPLTAVQVFDGLAYYDVTTANQAAGQGFTPFGPNAHVGAALLLGFGGPGLGPFTDQPITLMAYVQGSLARPVAQAGASAVPPEAIFAYEYWDGGGWSSLGLERDETSAFTTTGRFVVFGPGAATPTAAIGQIATPLYWIRLRMVSGGYERAPRLERIVPNTVSARQGTTVSNEVLGGSDGTPNQTFTLSTVPVLLLDQPQKVRRRDGLLVTVTSLRLEVDEGSGFEVWQQVDDFGASGPDDPHYILDRTMGHVTFGDGRNGAIPTANATLPASNIVARSWVAGGGAAGNVGAGTITALQSAVAGIASVVNSLAASGGADEETVDSAKVRAPEELQSKGRAVTASDFELIARDAPANVARANALPLVHPAYPNVQVPGAVTVLIVPDAPGNAPTPTQATLAAVCAYLDQHRLITTEVFATVPVYRQVAIDADVIVAADHDLGLVRNAVAAALTTWLHPLTGGPDSDGWPFGGTIYASDLFRVVLSVDGVTRIRDNQLTVILDGERQQFCRDVDLNPGELIEPLDPDLRVTYQ
jgi:predicted phage baseplate assembly protein